MDNVKEYDAVIVGGGIAGLYAAYYLQKTFGKNVIVLEAKDRVGGRISVVSLPCANGHDTWDTGGQWLGRTQHYLIQLMKELGLETYYQYSTGKQVLMLRSADNIRTYSGLIPNLGPLELLDIQHFLSVLTSLGEDIDLQNISIHPNAMEWDSMTFHTFVTNLCRSEVTREIIESVVRIVLGVDLSQISLLYMLYYAKQAGGFEALLETKNGGAQEFRVKGSMGQVTLKLADLIGHRNVVCSDPVCSINQEHSAYVEVTTESKHRYRGKHVIVAIPPHLVNDIQFNPPLPYDRIKLGKMPIGHLIKFIATYRSTFWREKGLSGQVVTTSLPCSSGPVTVTFDGTTSNGNPALVGFICADHAIYWSDKSTSERREAVLQSLASTLGEECLEPIHYEDKDWAKEPYNGGCPVTLMQPRGLLYYHHALRQPFGRIHWAGTETAQVWCGYIDGAVESGLRAAKEIGSAMPDNKKVKWKISDAFENTENYVSHFNMESNSSKLKTALKFTVAAGLLTAVGYFAIKKCQSSDA